MTVSDPDTVDVVASLRHMAAHSKNDAARLGALKELARIEETKKSLPADMPAFMEVVIHQICPRCRPDAPPEGTRTARV
jgi:hypothetical protein